MSQTFSQLINSLHPGKRHPWEAVVEADWMQGRTTYGGLSAALCLGAVEREYKDLPPLRSALVNFVGPAGGLVGIESEVMRQGRSVRFIDARMYASSNLATQATFCFGTSRESRLNNMFESAPNVPPVTESSEFFDAQFAPQFAKNFEVRLASGGRPVSASKHHEHFMWVRHRDPAAQDLTALVAIADMPPPAVLPMFEEFAPISSMTWMMNFLANDPSTEDGWWLVRSAAEHAREGYSSQDMSIWNSRGELVITARQNIAIFY